MRLRAALLVLGCCALEAQLHLPGSGGSKDAKPPAPSSSSAPAPAQPAKPSAPETSSGEAAAVPFDYYVLSLAWAPNFCAEPANAAANPKECAAGAHVSFEVHGLWPEAENGKSPESCEKAKPVSKAALNSVLPYMMSASLVQREWAAHGTCSGLSQADYFTDTIKARVAVQYPVQLTSLDETATESPEQVESQFAGANPSFPAQAFRAVCRGSDLTEIRVCFTRDLSPRECGAGAGQCSAAELRILPPR